MMDSQTVFLIRLLRARAHMASAREAPRVSLEAVALNDCADRLEALSDSKPAYTSPFDRMMASK